MHVELPQIKHPKSGLVKQGAYWSAIYYVDGNQRKQTTGEKFLKYAQRERDRLYAELTEEGATTLGGKVSPTFQDAIDNPNGMAYIYPQTSYRVKVAGKCLITTTDKQKAIDVRNEYITNNTPK